MSGPRAAVLGQPVAHSLSPTLHQAAYDALGLTDWTFERHEVGAADLPRFLASLDKRWRGLALTMPLKEAALALADVATDTAVRTGAANTLIRQGDSWHADNTDVWGIRAALHDAGARPEGTGWALVLGSGATARSALAAFSALGVRDVVFGVRDRVRPETLRQAEAAGMRTSVLALDDVARAVADAPVTVSTLPPGGADGVAAALEDQRLAGTGVLLDVVYAGWPTPLAAEAGRAGLNVVPGIEMLIHQAAAQVRSMTGRDAPLAAMQAAGRSTQRTRRA
ncbi:shikimate dehydrogenase [Allobranchiibius sp. CTAmp26]|nr:shikimate dehydrogenase [Allobranchiibius sp. CTAmp26]